MAAELIGIRGMLLADARSLASHGLLDAARLAGYRSRPGHHALAYDVLMLVEPLKKAHGSVPGRMPVTMGELHRAAITAEKLLKAIGLRDRAHVDRVDTAPVTASGAVDRGTGASDVADRGAGALGAGECAGAPSSLACADGTAGSTSPLRGSRAAEGGSSSACGIGA